MLTFDEFAKRLKICLHLNAHILLVEPQQVRDIALGALHSTFVQRVAFQATVLSRPWHAQ